MKFRSDLRNGFSLIELTMAVGIISFCLVAILGLFSIGLTSSRESINDMVQASILAGLNAEMRSLDGFDPASVRYFDADGGALTNSQGAIYAARLSTTGVPDSEIPDVSPYLDRVAVTITWPEPAPGQTNVFYVTLRSP